MRRIRQVIRQRPDGGDVLALFLTATLVTPLTGRLWGASLNPPFGITRGTLAAVAATVVVVAVLTGVRRTGLSGARGPLVRAALIGLLALLLERIITVRASGFYTAVALFEGVTVLLGLHMLASLMRRAARPKASNHPRTVRHGLLRRLRTRSDDTPVTAAAFADFVTDGIAMLVAAFWTLTALNARDVAFALMLVAGASELLVIVLRLPDAVRALERWTKPAMALVLVVALGAFAASARVPAASARFAFAPSAVACGFGPADTRPSRDPTPMRVPVTTASARRRREPPSPMSLRLNLPAYRLDVLADSVVVSTYRVAIGMRRYRTPVGTFAVHRIVWNPWWIPPDSPWARKEKVTPPGPDNPMGRVKLLIGGPYYVHGTPFVASIGSAASHGCIRMRNEDVMSLAVRLQQHAEVGLGEPEIAEVLADTVSRALDLPQPIPMAITYELAEVRGDSLLLHPDVYRRLVGATRRAAIDALATAGYDTLMVRRPVLSAAVRRARARHVTVAIDSVLQ